MSNLREECKERLKVAFDSVRSISESLSFLIVVDDYGLKILSNTIKTMELIEYGISVVERLDLKRKKIMKMQAVYLIHPDSIDKVLQDFDDESAPQYKYIHILSLSTFSRKDMQKMSQHEQFIKRLKTLKEINFSFSLHSHNQVKLCYMDDHSFEKSLKKNSEILQSTIDELSTIVTALPAFYIVEIYYQKGGISNTTEKIAQGLKEKLESLFDYFQKTSVPNYNSSAPVTTFLILDRSFDPVSPLVRDFHYLPLLYDQYDINNHRYTDEKKKKSFILNENDEIIDKYKNAHISTALKGISADFQEFSKNNTAAKFSKNQNKGLGMKELGEVMKKMPQFVELKDKYSFHYDALQNILDSMEKKQFKKQGFLQQSLLSLMNEEGKKLKEKDLLSDLVSTLQKTTSSQEKARLVLIGLLCLELKPKEQESLTLFLNKTPYKGIEKLLSAISNPSIYRFNPKKDKGNEMLDKHLPRIEELMKQISSNQNYGDLKALRVGAQKSVRPAHKHHSNIGLKKIKFDTQKKDRPKMIIFMNSAMGYNEMRSLSQFQSTYHIIYASHNFVTQNQYLNKIRDFGKAEEQEQL